VSFLTELSFVYKVSFLLVRRGFSLTKKTTKRHFRHRLPARDPKRRFQHTHIPARPSKPHPSAFTAGN